MIPNTQENRVPSAENRLLAALSRKDRQHFLSGCEQVELVFGNILCEPGETIRHVYFPTDSIISLMTPIDGHSSLEVALVGSEGMYGFPSCLGWMFHRCMPWCRAQALRGAWTPNGSTANSNTALCCNRS